MGAVFLEHSIYHHLQVSLVRWAEGFGTGLGTGTILYLDRRLVTLGALGDHAARSGVAGHSRADLDSRGHSVVRTQPDGHRVFLPGALPRLRIALGAT